MKKLIQGILLCGVFICMVAAAPKMIVGANVEGPVNTAPAGTCGGGAFAMSNDGTFSSVDETTFITLGIAPAENGGSGFGYITTRTSGSDTRLTKISLSALTNQGSSLINVSDVPDVSTNDKGNFYNTFTNRFTVVGRESAGATCGTTCIQIRDYNNAVLVNDVVTAAGSASGPDYGPTFDSTHVFIAYSIAGGSNLGKFNTGSYTFADNVFIVDSNVVTVSGIAVDSTYVYAPQNVSFRILRYTKANISGGPLVGFTPGLTDTFQIPSISTDGFLYIPTRSNGLSSNIMYRVRTSDMTITGQVNLGATQFLGKVLIDEVNNKLYLSVASGDFQNQIVRVDRTSLAIEATFSGVGQTNGPRTQYSQIDVVHQRIYVPINGSGAGDVSKVEKVKLCTSF